MTVIPVIDLSQGLAVHARQGQRDRYRPVQSPLCHHGAVLPLVRVLYRDFGCRLLYLADLDAIQGMGSHTALLSEINRLYPALELWIDAGFRGPVDIDTWRESVRFSAVIGSETWLDRGPLPGRVSILSIDLDERGLRDPSGLAADPARHPDNLILMHLRHIGGTEGPDFGLLKRIRSTNPTARLFLAGGIRDIADLHTARSAGASGVLLASALHDGRIRAAELARFS